MAERLTVTEKIRRSITEAQWQAHVIQIARLNGWMAYHPPDNIPGKNGHVQKVTPGWPDLVLVRDGRMVVAELKTATGKTTAAQDHWLDELSRVPGVETYVWRPGDDDKVLAVLRRRPV